MIRYIDLVWHMGYAKYSISYAMNVLCNGGFDNVC